MVVQFFDMGSASCAAGPTLIDLSARTVIAVPLVAVAMAERVIGIS
jgi:hypothetical protein